MQRKREKNKKEENDQIKMILSTLISVKEDMY
jgi:hypothetical protein